MEVPGIELPIPNAGEAESKGLFETAEKILKWLAVAVLLITGLGYPAVIVQFVWHGIPVSFVDKELAIRAGLMPALALFLLVAVLLYMVNDLRRGEDVEMREWIGKGYVANIYAGVVVAFLASALANAMAKTILAWMRDVQASSTAAGQAWRWWAGSAVAVAGLGALIGLLMAPMVVGVSRIFGFRWPAFTKGALIVYIPAWRFFRGMQPYSLCVISWIAVCLEFILLGRWELSIAGPLPWTNLVDVRPYHLLYTLALFSIFPFVFAMLAQRYYAEALESGAARRLQMKLRIAAVFFAYVPLVTIHALVFWPEWPGWIGGGRPSPVTVWLEAKEFPKSAVTKLTRLRMLREGEHLRLEKCFLLYTNSEVAILSDSDDAYAAAMVLPRDAVKAFAAAR